MEIALDTPMNITLVMYCQIDFGYHQLAINILNRVFLIDYVTL